MSWDVGDLDPRDQLRHTHCWPDTYTGHSLGPVLLQRGVRGQPFVAPPVNCRAQDVQIIPSHTAIPAPAQHTIVQQQTQIASTESPEKVAAMSPSVGNPSTVMIPSGVIIPPTNSGRDIPDPTTLTTIRVTLP